MVQKIQTNNFSYDVVLFNDCIIKNIANFCCTNDVNLKSALCFDFTFDLGKNPPYYVLVTSFQNTSLVNKSTKKSPAILVPILICYKKDENSVKPLCDTILDSCPGLSLNLKVIVADGESSISNQACNAFPTALLLICIRHIRENIKQN